MGEEGARGGVFVGVHYVCCWVCKETGRQLRVVVVVACAEAGAVLDKQVVAVGVVSEEGAGDGVAFLKDLLVGLVRVDEEVGTSPIDDLVKPNTVVIIAEFEGMGRCLYSHKPILIIPCVGRQAFGTRTRYHVPVVVPAVGRHPLRSLFDE